MENLRSLQNENGVNPDAPQADDMEPLAMPPEFDVVRTNRTTMSASTKPAGLDKVLTKPKRPLSAYNIFFKHEREKLVSNEPAETNEPITLESLKVDPKRKTKKRRHRKSHGKIGFADLARTIAEKWKNLDAESRKVFEACAAKEKERYQKEITEWKAIKKTEAAADEAALRTQIAMNQEALGYSSRGGMNDGMGLGGRDLQDSRNFDSTGWSSRAMTDSGTMFGGPAQAPVESSSTGGVQDPRDYLKITQQVIDMARASLSLPLFANIGSGGASGGGMMDDSSMGLMGDYSSLRTGGNQSSSLYASSNGNMGSTGLSNGALLNVPYGNRGEAMASLDSDSRYQNHELMDAMENSVQRQMNQISQLRDELESRRFLNQPMQQYQGDFDSGGPPPQDDYSDLAGQSSIIQDQLRSLRNTQDHDLLLNSLRNSQDQGGLLSSLRNHVSRQADNEDLANMINNASSLRDHKWDM